MASLLTKIATNFNKTTTSRPPLLFLSSLLPNSTHFYSSSPHNTQLAQSHHFLFPTPLNSNNYDTLIFKPQPDYANNKSQVDSAVHIFRNTSEAQLLDSLHHSDIQLTGTLVSSLIWALRHEWELAFLVFKLACNDARSRDLIIWVLGQHNKFTTAWRLIRNMLRSSIDARQPLLIMIQSYAGANLGGKAMETFQAMEKLRIRQDMEALHTLLRALCKNGNIEEAEEFMQLNKKHFPLCIASFNIILNGWCNICVDLSEAKRVWREMCGCCVMPDATSYAYMISCFSKAADGDLCNSLRLYDDMKKRGWTPCLNVYNSLLYILTRDNCFKEALRLVEKIKEAGLQPDSTTYNSIVVALGGARKVDGARAMMREMVAMGLNPSREAYHALVENVETVDVIVELVEEMKQADCGPCAHTFVLILNNLKQPEDALRMWVEMMKYELLPDAFLYSVMVRELARCGWLAKAKKFYDEMKAKGFPDDPAIKLLFTRGRQEQGDNHEYKNKSNNERRTAGASRR